MTDDKLPRLMKPIDWVLMVLFYAIIVVSVVLVFLVTYYTIAGILGTA